MTTRVKVIGGVVLAALAYLLWRSQSRPATSANGSINACDKSSPDYTGVTSSGMSCDDAAKLGEDPMDQGVADTTQSPAVASGPPGTDGPITARLQNPNGVGSAAQDSLVGALNDSRYLVARSGLR